MNSNKKRSDGVDEEDEKVEKVEKEGKDHSRISLNDLTSSTSQVSLAKKGTIQTKILPSDLEEDEAPIAPKEEVVEKVRKVRKVTMEVLDHPKLQEVEDEPKRQAPQRSEALVIEGTFDIKISKIPLFIIISLLILPNFFSNSMIELLTYSGGDEFNLVPILILDGFKVLISVYIFLTPFLCFLAIHFFPSRSKYIVECTRDSLKTFLILESTGEVRREDLRWYKLAGMRMVKKDSWELMEILNENGNPIGHVRRDMEKFEEFRAIILSREAVPSSFKNELMVKSRY